MPVRKFIAYICKYRRVTILIEDWREWKNRLKELESGRGARTEEGSLYMWSADYCQGMIRRIQWEITEYLAN